MLVGLRETDFLRSHVLGEDDGDDDGDIDLLLMLGIQKLLKKFCCTPTAG